MPYSGWASEILHHQVRMAFHPKQNNGMFTIYPLVNFAGPSTACPQVDRTGSSWLALSSSRISHRWFWQKPRFFTKGGKKGPKIGDKESQMESVIESEHI